MQKAPQLWKIEAHDNLSINQSDRHSLQVLYYQHLQKMGVPPYPEARRSKMKFGRREFIQAAAGLIVAARTGASASLDWLAAGTRTILPGNRSGAQIMSAKKTYDAAVIGAGVFGSWTAWHLAKAGKKVALLDAYGPANARASSSGESRIIRMGYGPDELYTRWSMRALALWKEFFERTGNPLFHQTGVLWLAGARDTYTQAAAATLGRIGVRIERLSRADLEKRFPQFNLDGVEWGLFEPESGALMARRAVQVVAEAAVKSGVDFIPAAAAKPAGRGTLDALKTAAGEEVHAGTFVFACGPWLGKIFSELLGERIFPSRQEVFFLGPPAGDARFSPPAMPTWILLADEVYGLPDLETRGFKIAFDAHGERVDPDTQSRVVSAKSAVAIRKYVARRFPALKDAPVVETRVCQYENTWSGDFLIDRHPDFSNLWLVGGGSGHGFKHGPALGEYLAARIVEGGAVEPRFSLATKQNVQKRAVY